MSYSTTTYSITPLSVYQAGLSNCKACYGRGYFFFWNKTGSGRICMHKPCPHCTGVWARQSNEVDAEMLDLLDWFKNSVPPMVPFMLSAKKRVTNPDKFWSVMKDDIATDNVYRLDMRREDLKRIKELFGQEEIEVEL